MKKDNKKINSIVLTGGPGGGKTTVLPLCIDCLLSAGYDVISLAEAATTIMNSGISVKNEVVDSLEFQRFVFKYQLFWEETIKKGKYKSKRPLIVLLDRSIIDSKAYITEKQWQELMEGFNLDELSIFSRYDLVVHLVTAAYGAEHAYTCENNPQRGEKNIEDARKAEDRVKSAYYGHLNVRYVDNSTDFDQKMQRVVDVIFEHLNLAKPSLKQRKFLVNVEKFLCELEIENPQYRDFEQTYLLSTDSNIERRLRKIGLNDNYQYFYTIKYKDNSIGVKDYLIGEDRYNLLLKEADITRSTIKKRRWYFSKDNIYYTLDDFGKNIKIGILEARVTTKNTEISFNSYDGFFKEVTGDAEFDNFSISKSFPKEFFKE